MKKVTLVLVLALLLIASLPVVSLEISVGAKGGIAHSQYVGKDHRDYIDPIDYKNALFLRAIFGAFATIGINEHLHIQPEILYIGSGGKAADSTTPADDYFVERYSYLGVPVLVKWVFSVLDGRLFVLGGPAVQFALGDGTDAVEDVVGGTATFFDLDLAPVHLTLMIGAGYNLALLGGNVSFELRLIQSVSRSFDQDVLDDDHRTGSIAVIAGYAYSLKK